MTLSLPVAVVTILSLVLGYLTQAIQSGSFLGIKTVPKTWLPPLTIASTLLGGFVAYLKGQSPLDLDGPTLFYATVAGLTALLAGSAPSLAMHAHATMPAARFAMRQSAPANANAVARAATMAIMVLAMGAAVAACVTAQKIAPPAIATAACVATDAIAGKSIQQIEQDCGGDAAQIVSILLNPATYQDHPTIRKTPAYLEADSIRAAVIAAGPQS